MDKKTSNTKAIFWDLQGTLGGEATEDIVRFAPYSFAKQIALLIISMNKVS